MVTEPIRSLPTSALAAALRQACDRLAPLWSLENAVAVNPYLGMADRTFEATARHLDAVAGARMTMPASFYLDELDRGTFGLDDLRAVVADGMSAESVINAARMIQGGERKRASVPTVADVAEELTGDDWSSLLIDRVSTWAGAHFDQGQARWTSPDRNRGLYAAWHEEASFDRTPEILGIPGFRRVVSNLPDSPLDAAAEGLSTLGMPIEGLALYLHRLLMRVGGWSAYTARIAWERRQHHQEEDDTPVQFLAVLIAWEVALLHGLGDRGVRQAWAERRSTVIELAQGRELPRDRAVELTLHRAYEHAQETHLRQMFDTRGRTSVPEARPNAQAVFCIDVRSEVFRRHLEAVGDGVETHGFAGFFGFPINHVHLGDTRDNPHCPVLVAPTHTVHDEVVGDDDTDALLGRKRIRDEVAKAWKTFAGGAVSCFGFVGPMGITKLPRLLTDSFGLTRPVPDPERGGWSENIHARRRPSLEPAGASAGIPLADRVDLAENALRGMSLTARFGRLVIITGHGSTTVNNPHASGLDCGACGGRSGAPNARVAAAVFNDREVRDALCGRGIKIPDDTVFVAALHDTTTDRITLFDVDLVPDTHRADLAGFEQWCDEAGHRTRVERAARMGVAAHDLDAAILSRSRDWAQVRPEWGLAGCTSFIAAPAHRVRGLDLGGRSFLHTYRWREDEEFGVLASIMAAPMVVASWINLQYYASTVDNDVFGAGNKTLHNVVGTVGVLEGHGGDLRVGLPLQSVHDGERPQHDPLRLQAVIEAPIEAMNAVIEANDTVRRLVDQGWLHLYAMNAEGRISHRYDGGLRWTRLDGADPARREEHTPRRILSAAE